MLMMLYPLYLLQPIYHKAVRVFFLKHKSEHVALLWKIVMFALWLRIKFKTLQENLPAYPDNDCSI